MAKRNPTQARPFTIVVDVCLDFSKSPAGRFRTDGPNSAERFREDYLVPALRHGVPVLVCLDHTLGFSSSFLEEAFGNLPAAGYTVSDLQERLEIDASDKSLVTEAWQYILGGQPPAAV